MASSEYSTEIWGRVVPQHSLLFFFFFSVTEVVCLVHVMYFVSVAYRAVIIAI